MSKLYRNGILKKPQTNSEVVQDGTFKRQKKDRLHTIFKWMWIEAVRQETGKEKAAERQQ